MSEANTESESYLFFTSFSVFLFFLLLGMNSTLMLIPCTACTRAPIVSYGIEILMLLKGCSDRSALIFRSVRGCPNLNEDGS